MKKREENLDLLRIISAVMVIVLHVGAIYGKEVNLTFPNYYFTVGNFYHSVTRTAVPTFVILSGYFLLSNIKNLNWKKHYKRTFSKIIIPTVIFSGMYVIYSIGIGVIKNGKMFDMFKPFKNWLNGQPYYHMWYMYMIIGLYLITPILIKIRLNIGDKKFEIYGWIFMFIGMVINSTSITVIWPFQFILYLGYFILGYSLGRRKKGYKGSFKIYLILSIVISLIIFIITEFNIRYSIINNKFYFLTPLSPLVIISSLLLYVAFIKMDWIKCDVEKIAEQTFYIYLYHAGVLSIIDIGINIFIPNPNPVWYIPVVTIIVFSISYILSKITNYMIKRIKKL